MREYSQIGPQFWIGKTGKRLRAAGPLAQIVSFYLMTAPTSNMLGLYYIPLQTIGYETGLGIEGASKGLQGCIEAQFCDYCEESEVVWVYEMARYQVADELKAGDRRCKGVQNAYDRVPANPFLIPFFARYAQAFYLTAARSMDVPLGSPFDGACIPHRSQEQEQEQEQEQDLTNPDGLVVASQADDVQAPRSQKIPCPHEQIIALYHEVLPMCPRVRDWTPARASLLRARWSENEKRQNLDYWRLFFEYVATCDFLVGKGGKPFIADLAWMVKAENFAKIREEKYENRAAR